MNAPEQLLEKTDQQVRKIDNCAFSSYFVDNLSGVVLDTGTKL